MAKTKTTNEKSRNQMKSLIIDKVKNQKPETTKQLIQQIKQRCTLPETEITRLPIELENENKLHFKQEANKPASAKAYVFSRKASWYWNTIAIATITAVTVFTILEDLYPIVYIRFALGIIFVLYLPGYAFIKALFLSEVPFKNSSENLGTIERAALSLGTSLAIAPIIGLILNPTPWEITLTTITLSLLALINIFATVAILREHLESKQNSPATKATNEVQQSLSLAN
jgi:hypothetical protein